MNFQAEPEAGTGEFSLLDDETTQPDSTPTFTGDLQCQVCGTELHYAGRGRKPKFCAEHKPTKSVASGSRKSTNVDTLIGQIHDMYLSLGMVAGAVPPLAMDSMIIASNAQRMAESWRPLIERDARIRKLWERICTGGGWGTVVMAHGVVALAIMQAHKVQLPGFANAMGGTENG